MKFLVVSKPKYPVPLEMGLGLIDAMAAWVEQNSKSGKIVETWGFAGSTGGGGILSVASLDELDAVMAGFPFAAFSETEIFPLVDLAGALERGRAVLQAMAGG